MLIIAKLTIGVMLGLILPSYSVSSEIRQNKKSTQELSLAQTILLKATYTTASEQISDPAPIQKIFSRRMEELSYITKTDDSQDYDVIVELDCKEQNTGIKQRSHTKRQKQLSPIHHVKTCASNR